MSSGLVLPLGGKGGSAVQEENDLRKCVEGVSLPQAFVPPQLFSSRTLSGACSSPE